MIMIGIALLPACLMHYDDPFKVSPDLLYCKEYDESCEGNIDTDYYYGRSEDFAIGANSKNIAVFKDPRKAFDTFRRLYWKELLIVQLRHFLLPIGRKYYLAYEKYAWQSSDKENYQFISRFLDIYDNSFISY